MVNGVNKYENREDYDDTVIPPALSFYSIGLFNEDKLRGKLSKHLTWKPHQQNAQTKEELQRSRQDSQRSRQDILSYDTDPSTKMYDIDVKTDFITKDTSESVSYDKNSFGDGNGYNGENRVNDNSPHSQNSSYRGTGNGISRYNGESGNSGHSRGSNHHGHSNGGTHGQSHDHNYGQSRNSSHRDISLNALKSANKEGITSLHQKSINGSYNQSIDNLSNRDLSFNNIKSGFDHNIDINAGTSLQKELGSYRDSNSIDYTPSKVPSTSAFNTSINLSRRNISNSNISDLNQSKNDIHLNKNDSWRQVSITHKKLDSIEGVISSNLSNSMSHNSTNNSNNSVSEGDESNSVIHTLNNRKISALSNSASIHRLSSNSSNSFNANKTKSEEDLDPFRLSSAPSNIRTLKARSMRRIGKALGPPQRARKVVVSPNENNLDSGENIDIDGKSQNVSDKMEVDGNNEINGYSIKSPHNGHNSNVSEDFELRKSINNNGSNENSSQDNNKPSKLLYKDNEIEYRRSLNHPSPETSNVPDILSKENEIELRRRVEQQKSKVRHEHNVKRVPLQQISTNVEEFRKPKLPKLANAPSSQPHNNTNNQQTNLQTQSNPTKKKAICINGKEYEKLELLGRGGSSKVYKVKSVDMRLFAIKKVLFDQFDDACVAGFKGEIDLLTRLRHSDRVVKLIDHAIGEGEIYLVMECGDLDLAHVFQNRINLNKTLDLLFVQYHAVEMLKCVQAVHEADIVHSDLKPANFLFVKGMLKIIDFGIANAVPDHTANIYRESQIGTPNYMAPEALIEINQPFPGVEKNTWKVGKPSDVWSCGCIIYQMVYGKPPYGGYSGNQRIMAIINPHVQIQFPKRGIGEVRVPTSVIELMKNCLARNPNDRWTIEQCLRSDFLDPKIVNEAFIRDLIHLAVNFGYQKVSSGEPVAAEVYDQLVATVIDQIKDLNYHD